MMSDDDRAYMEKDGNIAMKCEFCSHEYVFNAKEIERKIRAMKADQPPSH